MEIRNAPLALTFLSVRSIWGDRQMENSQWNGQSDLLEKNCYRLSDQQNGTKKLPYINIFNDQHVDTPLDGTYMH